MDFKSRLAQKKGEDPNRILSFFLLPRLWRGTTCYFRLFCTATATATVAPTMGLLPMPRKPIIST